jgi:hypothetical protein
VELTKDGKKFPSANSKLKVAILIASKLQTDNPNIPLLDDVALRPVKCY